MLSQKKVKHFPNAEKFGKYWAIPEDDVKNYLNIEKNKTKIPIKNK